MILGLIKLDGGIINKREDVAIGYSPEIPYFSPYMTGFETLVYYGCIQGIDKRTIKQEANELLEKVGLEKDKVKVKHYLRKKEVYQLMVCLLQIIRYYYLLLWW